MAVHQSSVNFENLIRDLAEMYPFDVGEVVVSELVANALDAGATRIDIRFDPEARRLVVTDDGKGMSASDFAEYHDFAAGIKTRGGGIGFAGVGAKISFNIADRVVTETRSATFSGGSKWYLQSRKKLIWEDSPPTHLRRTGTKVEVYFRASGQLTFSSGSDLRKLLQRHYLPLFDESFLELYARMGIYERGLRFSVNGITVEPGDLASQLELESIRRIFPQARGRRVGYGLLGIAPTEYPISPDLCGVLLCARGKLVKGDFFNQFPGALGPRIFGLVEIPAFVDFLTTAKTDFARRLKPGEFEKLYGPIRQEFKGWLSEIGVASNEVAGADEASRLERELRKVLDDIPELSEFFGFRTPRSILQESPAGGVVATIHDGAEATYPLGDGVGRGNDGPLGPGDESGTSLEEDRSGDKQSSAISRTARRGPKVGFAEAPDKVELAWVEGNRVMINASHPSYARARSDTTARRHHCLFAIGSAIQRYLAAPDDVNSLLFVDRMMAAWGKR